MISGNCLCSQSGPSTKCPFHAELGLREENARLISALESVKPAIEALRDTMQKQEAEITRLRQLLGRAREHGTHLSSCTHTFDLMPPACYCGWETLKREIDAELKGEG